MTVGMAYEGLDCPEITHIACLTQVRSAEWLEPMLARPASIAARESGRRPRHYTPTFSGARASDICGDRDRALFEAPGR